MGSLGVFVDRQVMGSAEQLTALIRLRDQAEAMGHGVDFIFPVEVRKVARVDGLFIRQPGHHAVCQTWRDADSRHRHGARHAP